MEEDALKKLQELCDKFQELKFEIEKQESKLENSKRELENVSRNLIPPLLNDYGLSEVRLISGEKVIVSDKIKASISAENSMSAYKNMIKEEGGDQAGEESVDSLFKKQLVIEDQLDRAMKLLLQKQIPYDQKMSIHHQTLSKYCRLRLEEGKEIPKGISVFQYQETSIKK